MNPHRTVLVTAHTGRAAAVTTARLVVEMLISAGIAVRIVDTEAAELQCPGADVVPATPRPPAAPRWSSSSAGTGRCCGWPR